MADEERTRPTTDQPLNAPGKRPVWRPILAVVLLAVVVLAVFLLITWLQQNT